MSKLTYLLLTLCLPALCLAADNPIKVDPLTGDDTNDGRSKPLKTINRAIEIAAAGDTINLEPTTYFETVKIANKHGKEGKPITINGNGAVIDGSQEVKAPDWRNVYPGTYRAEGKALFKDIDADLIDRFFMISKGQLNRMGRCVKLEKSLELQDTRHIMKGEWTYSRFYSAFLLVIDPKKTLEEEKMRYPALKNAIVLSGSNSWITIKNLTGIRVYNDGFTLEGNQQNIKLENVGAMDCGDDGFYISGDVKCEFAGLMSIGNGCGIHDTGTGFTHFSNVLIKDCVAYDLYFQGNKHTLENGVIDSIAPCPLLVDANVKQRSGCVVTLKQLRLTKSNNIAQGIKVVEGGHLNAEGCQFIGVDLAVTGGGEVELQSCSIDQGEVKPASPDVEIAADAVWKGDNNRYNLGTLKMGETKFTPASFAQFKSLTNSEKQSSWGE